MKVLIPKFLITKRNFRYAFTIGVSKDSLNQKYNEWKSDSWDWSNNMSKFFKILFGKIFKYMQFYSESNLQ